MKLQLAAQVRTDMLRILQDTAHGVLPAHHVRDPDLRTTHDNSKEPSSNRNREHSSEAIWTWPKWGG